MLKKIIIAAAVGAVIAITVIFIVEIQKNTEGKRDEPVGQTPDGNAPQEKEPVIITPPESQTIIQDGKEFVFQSTETFTIHPSNTNEAIYVYVSQNVVFAADGLSMRPIYVYHVYRASDSDNLPENTDIPPGTTTIVIDDTWEFLETIETSTLATNTNERVYIITEMQYVLVDPNDAGKGMKWIYIYDVYVKITS